MKRRDLIRHLSDPIPRHREIPDPLARAICRQLEIPLP